MRWIWLILWVPLAALEWEAEQIDLGEYRLVSDRIWINKQGVIAGNAHAPFRWHNGNVEWFDSWRDSGWVCRALAEDGTILLKSAQGDHLRSVDLEGNSQYLESPQNHAYIHGAMMPGEPHVAALIIDLDTDGCVVGKWNEKGELKEITFPEWLKLPDFPYHPFVMNRWILIHGQSAERYLLARNSDAILIPTHYGNIEGIAAAGGTLICTTHKDHSIRLWDVSWDREKNLFELAPPPRKFGMPLVRAINARNEILFWDYYLPPCAYLLIPEEDTWEWHPLPKWVLKPLALSDSGAVLAVCGEDKLWLLRYHDPESVNDPGDESE